MQVLVLSVSHTQSTLYSLPFAAIGYRSTCTIVVNNE